MCLYTANKTPLIAIVPIRVWKRLNIIEIKDKITYRTPYQDIEIKVGDILLGLNPNKKVLEGINFKKCIVDIQAVHAYKTKYDAEFWKEYGEIITEWEIPAGAKYWVGSEYSKGEIAATEMKFINVCED